MIGVSVTLGLFLLLESRHPSAIRNSLMAFTAATGHYASKVGHCRSSTSAACFTIWRLTGTLVSRFKIQPTVFANIQWGRHFSARIDFLWR
jgi:hypothetical protein